MHVNQLPPFANTYCYEGLKLVGVAYTAYSSSYVILLFVKTLGYFIIEYTNYILFY